MDRKVNLLELKNLSKSLSLNKAAGPDEITNEILKELIEIIGEYIVDLYNDWLSNGKIEKEVLIGLVTLLYKKGDKMKSENTSLC